jgi:hypothetical protein
MLFVGSRCSDGGGGLAWNVPILHDDVLHHLESDSRPSTIPLN